MDHRLRRDRLVERLEEVEVDAFFVTRLPNVRYLSGFTGSNAQLLLAPEGAVFFIDGRYIEQSSREAPDLELEIYLEGPPPVGAVAPRFGVRRLGFESQGVTYGEWAKLRDGLDGVELVPLEGEIERQRRPKDEEERAFIARAQEAADAAFERVVLGGLREGVTERELALELELAMREAGADERGFETIVAFGENTAEPHHHPTERALRRGDVVKLDFGALAAGYHSDMTRTVALGEPAPRLRETYDVVAAAQRAGIEAVRAGGSTMAVDRAARSVVEAAGLGEAFSHGLVHGVGLEIHEAPFLRWDSDDTLAEGMVVTIEPGVYIPGLGGVRIEDMVEVTADGCRQIPRSTKELVVL